MKKFILFAVALALCTTLFGCSKEKEPDITTLQLYVEEEDIRDLIVENEKRTDLSDDEKEYFNCLKKSLVKMADGYTYTLKSDTLGYVVDTLVLEYHSDDSYKVCGPRTYQYSTFTFKNELGDNDSTTEVTMLYDEDTMYMRLANNEGETKEIAKISDYMSEADYGLEELGDTGISSTLIPAEAQEIFKTLKKSTENGNTVFTFNRTVNTQAGDSTISGSSTTKVTFNAKGLLLSVETQTSMDLTYEEFFDDEHQNVTSTYSFSDLGVHIDITAPADADEYKPWNKQ